MFTLWPSWQTPRARQSAGPPRRQCRCWRPLDGEDLLMGAPANRRFHSAPMALNRATSICGSKRRPPSKNATRFHHALTSNALFQQLHIRTWRRARCALPGRNFLYSTTCCHIGTSVWACNTLHNAANRRGLHKMMSQEKGHSLVGTLIFQNGRRPVPRQTGPPLHEGRSRAARPGFVLVKQRAPGAKHRAPVL